MKIFVTGSNAKLLSSEISTSLTGRNLVLKLYPFSFTEFLIYKNKSFNLDYLSTVYSVNLKILFNEYLQYGGFPLVLYEQNLQIIDIFYQDILCRDIVARYNLSQVDELKSLSTSLIINIGKLFSYSKLKDITKMKSLSSLKTYLDYLSNSYLLYYLSKFDYLYNKQVLNSKKVYVQDIGFHNSLGFKFSNDKGRILENIVFIELKRRGKKIYYHKDKKECDFIIKEGLDTVSVIQVTQSLENGEEWIETKKKRNRRIN
ncbi:MAG: ATP-binding protein [Nanoarchaeota archaeon]